ncbi:MAG: SDR family oxidoreductase [Eubacteriales bacterium]|nr:SDR family oxidoreductase [Eubacteriales bacterium]
MNKPISNMEKAFDLTGKNVIVTGGNRGIGKGIAEAMAQSGANIAIICRNSESARQTVEELSQYGGEHKLFIGDISLKDSVCAAVQAVYEEYKKVDVLVNNAGIGCVCKFLDMDDDMSMWHRVMDTDMNGTARMTFEVGKRMRKAGGGCIINITSKAGQRANKAHPASMYHAAKAAVDHLTRCLAVEFAPYNIRVNAIAPGYTNTQLSDQLPEGVQERAIREIPTHRFADPIELGALAVFLASSASTQMTGVVINHDGGFGLSD